MRAADLLNYRSVRFLVSGGSAAIVYAIAVRLLFAGGLSLGWSGALAYLVSTPVGYVLHRQFTFRSVRPVRIELPRFIAVSLLGLACASWIPAQLSAPRGLALDLPWAIALTCIATPLITFTLKSLWVFKNAAGAPP